MTTLTYGIGLGTDDGYTDEWNGGHVNLTQDQTLIGVQNNRGSQQSLWAGFRFQAVAMPNGQAVDSADIELYITFTRETNGPADYNIYGDDQDDAPTWAATAPNRPGYYVDVTETTATYQHTETNVLDTTINLTVDTIVNEICARAGWVNGNDMRFSFQDNVLSLKTQIFGVATYEHVTHPEPILNIIYTVGAAGQPTMRRWSMVPGMGIGTGYGR